MSRVLIKAEVVGDAGGSVQAQLTWRHTVRRAEAPLALGGENDPVYVHVTTDSEERVTIENFEDVEALKRFLKTWDLLR